MLWKRHEIHNFQDMNLSCTNRTCFCENYLLKESTVKKMKSIWSHDELVLMFPNEKESVHPKLTRRKQQGEFQGLLQELKLYHGHFLTYLRIILGLLQLFSYRVLPLRRQWNHFRHRAASSYLSQVKLYYSTICIFSTGVHIESCVHLLRSVD